MENSDKPLFFQIMYGIADNFSAELNEFGLEFRFRALRHFSIDEIEKAAFQIVQNRKYTKMPTVAEFVGVINGNPEDRAEIEAARVLQAVKRIGAGQSVDFDDPVTKAVIKFSFGGWVQLCSALRTDREGWFLRDFAKAYQTYCRNGIKEHGHLPGMIEAKNAGRFKDYVPDPVLIGGQEMTRRIPYLEQDMDEASKRSGANAGSFQADRKARSGKARD